MRPQLLSPRTSERGIALISVLLLLAVMSGLIAGMAFSGHVETAMSLNETYFAGARAAAEAGMNRAIEAITNDTTHNQLFGEDDTAATADDGDPGYLMAGFTAWPEGIGTTGEYSYTIEIFDDDNDALYSTALTPDQLTAMGEDGDPTNNTNDRLILRATGWGPNNTLVRISRVLDSVDNTSPGTNVTSLSNPAILVDGDLEMDGNFHIEGDQGNVHANGDLDIDGVSGDVSGDITCVGDLTAPAGFHADGTQAGGQPSITVPNINAGDYAAAAGFFLNADGTAHTGSASGPACGASCNGWTFAAGKWQITGTTAPTGLFYVATGVSISGSPGSAKSPKALSIVAEGSIDISGHPYLTPAITDPDLPGAFLQFVTNGDLKISGAADADDSTTVEGRTLVREQIDIGGTPDLQGQIIVQNVTSVDSLVTTNAIHGTVTVTYNGSFDPIETTTFIPGTTTYTNNVSGWLES